jgi:hypothetical protein
MKNPENRKLRIAGKFIKAGPYLLYYHQAKKLKISGIEFFFEDFDQVRLPFPSYIDGIEIINRGYEHFEPKLRAIGADFEIRT